MSVILSSTTDGPEEVKRALEAAGQTVESMDVFSNESSTEEKPDPSAPAESPASEAGKPGEGKTADESETPEDSTEEATEDEETEDGVEDTKPQDAGKKRGGAEKKIDRLTREKAKLAEERAERDGRIAELQRQVETLSKQKEPEPDKPEAAAEPEKKAPESKSRPQLADFESHEEWMEKLLEWKDEQHELKLNSELGKLRSELAAKDQKQTEQSAAQARMGEWFEHVAEVKAERYSDWDEVATKGKDVLFSPAMQEVMFDSEFGPDMLYFLTSNPEITKKIFDQTSYDGKATDAQVLKANRLAGVEMSRVEAIVRAKISEVDSKPDSEKPEEKPAASSTPKPKITTAPAPIKPNKGAVIGTKATPYESKMSYKEYQDWYRETHPRRTA